MTYGAQDYCWRKGRPNDLIAYCNMHKECNAVTLFANGFSLNPKYPHCWASAFFKTGNGQNLSLSTKLTLSPQAMLYVKGSAWYPQMADTSAPEVRYHTHPAL